MYHKPTTAFIHIIFAIKLKFQEGPMMSDAISSQNTIYDMHTKLPHTGCPHESKSTGKTCQSEERIDKSMTSTKINF